MQIFKGHAYGNDFLLTPLDETIGTAGRAELARALCHRHHGIGADGLIFYTMAPRTATMVLFGVVRATGAVLPPLVVLTVALLFIRYPLALAFLDEWQADAIWWSFPVSSLIAAALAVVYYKWGSWRTLRMGA